MVRVGQKVTRTPTTIGTMTSATILESKPMRGVVVYVHPKGRFHVVEFENARGEKIRESFAGVE